MLHVAFESTEVNGVKLRKTWSLARGSYVATVAHEVVNNGAAPVQPQLYLQLVRDGNPPAGESSFYFTFTGPAMYTDAAKFRKVEFKDIEKGKAEHDKSASDGWIAMVQHYFASAWLLPAGTPREFRTAKVSENLYSIAMVQALPAVAPGASAKVDAQLDAVDFGRLEGDVQHVGAVFERCLAGQRSHRCQVVRQRNPRLGRDQAGLGEVQPRGRAVEQHDRPLRVERVGVAQQLHVHQVAAQRVERGLHQVGRHGDERARHGRGRRR